MDYYTFLCWIILVACVYSQEGWNPDEPFLANTEEEERVQFGQYQNEQQLIWMDEAIDERITVAYFNYKGNEQPKVTRFWEPSSSSNNSLGVVIERTNSNENWGLIITIKQDYESGTIKYAFDVSTTGLTRRVYLHINNIDDEIPIIELLTNRCEIDENKVGVSTCAYAIRDADGVMNNVMDYSLTGAGAALFEIKDEIDLVNGVKQWTVYLNTAKCLDFESTALYLLDFTVTDSGNNKVTAKIVVYVTDMPDQPPVWTNIFTSQQFDEKQAQTFQIEAVDGDIELNWAINYELTSEFPFFSIHKETGVITVEPIDRDTERKELFTFQVKAFEVPDPNSSIEQRVTIVVNDVNDNVPKITLSPETLIIPENTATKLPLNIDIKDMDLGDNGTYEVTLRDDSGNDYHTAFQIVPEQGYQSSKFTISVVESTLLDYEEKLWQTIKVEIHAQEIAEASHVHSKILTINLENLNDELPIFTEENYIATVCENIDISKSIATVYAKDRDIDDTVKHSLLGKVTQKLFTIDEATGEITTRVKDAFDYETETEVIIQVQAEDSLFGVVHRVTTQLVVTVLDVNDEPPIITMPSNPISIEENQEHGTPVNNKDTEITAMDEDTTADLAFSINWEESYATKNGMPVDSQYYDGCIDVETVNNNYADHVKAVLTINEILPKNTPDFEKLDKLFIVLVVTDRNQTILPNSDKVTITINVEDVNDNAPVFDITSINSTKRVTERASSGTLIATIIATDEDGPKHNVIAYSIRPADSNIPDDWIDINPTSGTVFVKSDEEIDADGDVDKGRPPFWTLHYNVSAKDAGFTTTAQIRIDVIDINDNPPVITVFSTVVYMSEGSPNDTNVQRIGVTDADRDEAYNTPWFRFGSLSPNDDVKDFFSIDSRTGRVFVYYKDDSKELDRDKGRAEFTIPVIIGDNADFVGGDGRQNVIDNSFAVMLLDINSQDPKIKDEYETITTSEDKEKGSTIGEIEATDDDEPGTDNTKINFEVVSIKNAVEDPPQDLFTISTDENYESGRGTLTAQHDLRGYYGTFDVLIKTNDFGINPRQRFSEKTIHIDVNMYNFEAPKILYPPNEEKIYLEMEQTLGEPVIQYGGQPLGVFHATDSQGEKWNIEFRIDEDTDVGVFAMLPASKGKARLAVVSEPTEIAYTVKIVADCNCDGDEPYTASVIIYVRFISENSEPYFTVSEVNVEFPENDTGLIVTEQLPKAYFKEGEEWDQFKVYYDLKEDDSGCFEVDAETAVLGLKCMLDRENQSVHTLKVVASKNPAGNNNPDESSILTVLVKVLDVNDNPPNFGSSFYYGGVKPSDELGTLIVEITATDLDLDDSMTFAVVEETFEAHGNGIENIERPFNYVPENQKTLKIILNFVVQSNMNGYFLFNVTVTDEVGHSDTTSVKIYVVSDSSRTPFKFENNINDVELKKDKIKAIMECVFCMCNIIETIQKSINENGETVEGESRVLLHFFDSENEPIESTEIEQIASDYECFTNLRSQFLKEGLYLLSFTDTPVDEDMEEILRAWLIGVTVVLGTLCVILIIAFIVKTRSLVRRLENLSTHKFGSQESGLNRIGLAAPNTNKHAIEGSNPVYNEEKTMTNIDTASIGSGDSDLIGIEDNPNFEYNPEFHNETFNPFKEKF